MTESDVLIIGGGIAGVCTAFYLAQRGRRVTLLERGEIASEASGVNAGGMGGIGWGNSPDLRSYLTMGSLELFKDFQIGLGYDIEFRQSGGLQAIQTPAQYEFGCAKVLQLRSLGYDLELLSPREARSIEPEASPHLLGFIQVPGRGQADPVKATRGFAAAAQSCGARVVTNSPVTELTPLGDGSWSALTPEDEFRAGNLVLAAGAWCGPLGDLLGLTIPIVPVRGQMWATAVLPPWVHHVISAVESESSWAADSPASDSDKPGVPPELTHRDGTRTTRHLYGRQTKTGEIVFGGDRELLGYEQKVDAEGIEVNKGHVAEIIPLVAQLPIVRTWSGVTPFSLDGKPIIGKIPNHQNLFIVGGLASSGFGRGPMAAKLLAEYIHTGHRPQVLAEADPARCVTGRT
ncbi:MAG: hypothetical protein BZY75_00910 [SAR202 cluster bacterium Io17-Chloro-G7]|nr:MAG: hypothetical protein BZY75_00910 [SAR202 cluster bacterium Io17-Chloro-G7]